MSLRHNPSFVPDSLPVPVKQPLTLPGMKTAWFGDNRDLVKWASLLDIARERKASVIVQVCFLNPHKFPQITLDGNSVAMPPEVIEHFRSLRSVERLTNDIAITQDHLAG